MCWYPIFFSLVLIFSVLLYLGCVSSKVRQNVFSFNLHLPSVVLMWYSPADAVTVNIPGFSWCLCVILGIFMLSFCEFVTRFSHQGKWVTRMILSWRYTRDVFHLSFSHSVCCLNQSSGRWRWHHCAWGLNWREEAHEELNVPWCKHRYMLLSKGNDSVF